jgi:hypothetical protein
VAHENPQSFVYKSANLTGANSGESFGSFTAHADVYTMCLVRLPAAALTNFQAAAADFPLYILEGDLDPSLIGVFAHWDGAAWKLWTTWSSVVGGTALAADTWYVVEAHFQLSSSGGQHKIVWELRLGGAVIQNGDTVDLYGAGGLVASSTFGGPSGFRIGQSLLATAGANNFYYLDNVGVGNAGYIGSGAAAGLFWADFEANASVPPFDSTSPDGSVVASPGGAAATIPDVVTVPQGVCFAFTSAALASAPTWTRVDT